nr:hypothetical protein [Allomuricauda sp.]
MKVQQNKIIHRLLLLLCTGGVLIMLACTQQISKPQDTDKEMGYLEQLEDLRVRLKLMKNSNDPKKFMPLYKEIVPFLEQNVDSIGEATSFRSSVVQKLLDIGVYRQAIKQSYRALEANVRPNTKGDSILTNLLIYGKLLYAYDQTNEVDSLLHISQVAINDAKKHPKCFWLSSALNNAGQYFYQYGKEQTAYNYLREADSILEELSREGDIGAYRFQGNVQNNIADIYADQKEYQKAMELYAYNFHHRYAKFLNEEIRVLERQRFITNGTALADMQINLGYYKEAKETLQQTRIYMDTLVYVDPMITEIEYAEVKKKYYMATGDFQEGYWASERVNSLKDSLAAQENRLKTETMNLLANFSSGQMEMELAEERRSRQVFEERAKLQLWIICFVVVVSAGLVFGLVRFQKQRFRLLRTDKMLSDEKLKREEQQKQLLSLRLENKKKDLTDMALSLHQKQQWAKELDDQMKIVKSERGYKRSRELKKLQVEISRNVYVDNKLKLIQQNMDVLSHAFFAKLKGQFPDLTKSENKLCSFIKLGLTNVQIAQLQNVAPSSVRISRYRLKKKLKLSPEESLDVFIQEF